ncbi:MAG: pyruvate kinase [Planctomycetia bacterium]|nr:pyruvate kinase [Planctomycetia bacterium]
MNNYTKTKIVCTIGPACNSPAIIEELIDAGMNVARLNFSHGTLSEHEDNIRNIRQISSRLEKPVAIIQDLSGPKIRIGTLKKESITLKAGDQFTLTNKVLEGNEQIVSVTYPLLPDYVFAEDAILLCDGEIELKVIQKNSTDIVCEVIVGGVLSARKGINIPTRSLPIPSLTEKDKGDLEFGIEHDVDYIALSFVTNENDILQLREIIQQKNKDIPIIAKIEKHEALNRIEEIINTADAIMVARGDLGIEIPLEKIPLVQKKIIRIANSHCKPVITATQMLQSMVNNYRPTRAEVTDVANAIFDGSDAVMLSEETAKGRYPVESVRMLSKIAREVELGLAKKGNNESPYSTGIKVTIPDAISSATCQVADDLSIKAIITCTQTGSTARFVSKHRPKQLVLAVTPSLNTYRRLALVWGVVPMLTEPLQNTDDMMKKSVEAATKAGYISEGETLAITGGVPVWKPGSTNLLRVYQNG